MSFRPVSRGMPSGYWAVAPAPDDARATGRGSPRRARRHRSLESGAPAASGRPRGFTGFAARPNLQERRIAFHHGLPVPDRLEKLMGASAGSDLNDPAEERS